MSTYSDWLSEGVTFQTLPDEGHKKTGRRSVSFEDASNRTKRLKTETLRSDCSLSELLFAASMKFGQKGNEQGAQLLKLLYQDTQSAGEILNSYRNRDKLQLPQKLSPEEGVSVIIEADLSKAQYLIFRNVSIEHHADIFPSYHDILEAKKRAYPHPSSMTISEISAEVRLQDIVDLDAGRLTDMLKRKNVNLGNFVGQDLELLHKWGCDGSSGHAQYKQTFSHNTFCDESSMLLTAIVPLRLRLCDEENNTFLWNNPSPSSTRFCKPLRIQAIRETKESLIEEEKYFCAQIEAVKPTVIPMENGEAIKVHHKFTMTMIDGKMRNVLTHTSSMATCSACGATPAKMSVNVVKTRPINISAFKYGISVLHARIRFLECVLHVTYKLDIKKWSANKALYNERKTKIQNELRSELGLLVDVVKQGFGSTNDGNTARRFFENPGQVSAITGFDEAIIERFAAIQNALACGFEIDVDKFRKFSLDTAEMFEEKYPWYHMPASIHFILVHGADVMSALDLPMGMYSEEASEARNKNIRSFREHRTRKTSRIATMTDLFHRLLLTGDIYFSSLPNLKTKHQDLLQESVRNLLK